MKRILGASIILLSSFLLFGCNEAEIIGRLDGAVVKEKRIDSGCLSLECWTDYYVTFEKDGKYLELEIIKKNQYYSLLEGSHVSFSYDEQYVINEMHFDSFEEPNSTGKIDNLEVKRKRIEESCGNFDCHDNYYVLFEKNSEMIELEIEEKNMFNSLEKGDKVNLTYDEWYSVETLKLNF